MIRELSSSPDASQPELTAVHTPRVVQSLAELFSDPQPFPNSPFSRPPIPVVVYNTRGTGNSSGKASWTSTPEKLDYEAVVEWAINKVVERADSLIETSSSVDLTVYCCVRIKKSHTYKYHP